MLLFTLGTKVTFGSLLCSLFPKQVEDFTADAELHHARFHCLWYDQSNCDHATTHPPPPPRKKKTYFSDV